MLFLPYSLNSPPWLHWWCGVKTTPYDCTSPTLSLLNVWVFTENKWFHNQPLGQTQVTWNSPFQQFGPFEGLGPICNHCTASASYLRVHLDFAFVFFCWQPAQKIRTLGSTFIFFLKCWQPEHSFFFMQFSCFSSSSQPSKFRLFSTNSSFLAELRLSKLSTFFQSGILNIARIANAVQCHN